MRLLIAFLAFSALSSGSSIQELIAKYEGWGNHNSLTRQLHNPGALSFAKQPNAVYGSGGYAKWKTDEEGWRALDNDLQAKIRKYHPHTLRELLRFWDAKGYLSPMAKELGITPETKLRFLLIPH